MFSTRAPALRRRSIFLVRLGCACVLLAGGCVRPDPSFRESGDSGHSAADDTTTSERETKDQSQQSEGEADRGGDATNGDKSDSSGHDPKIEVEVSASASVTSTEDDGAGASADLTSSDSGGASDTGAATDSTSTSESTTGDSGGDSGSDSDAGESTTSATTSPTSSDSSTQDASTSDESSSSGTANMGIDLRIVSIGLSDPNPVAGVDYFLEFAVENVGDTTSPAPAFIVTAGEFTSPHQLSFPLVPGGGGQSALRFQFATSGNFEISVVADPDMLLADVDRSNNTLTDMVTVGAPP